MGLTTDPDDPELGRGPGGEGLNKKYLVLSEEERAKGFVRPVRRGYMHVGRALCGKPNGDLYEKRLLWGTLREDVAAFVCSGLPGHDGECSSWLPVTAKELDQVEREGKVGGCGTVTWMAQAIAETYARQPTFYGATYCCGCKTHLPVGAHGEFVWMDRSEPIPLWVGT